MYLHFRDQTCISPRRSIACLDLLWRGQPSRLQSLVFRLIEIIVLSRHNSLGIKLRRAPRRRSSRPLGQRAHERRAVEWGQTPLSATFRGRPTPFDTVRLWVSASIFSEKRVLPNAHPLCVQSRIA